MNDFLASLAPEPFQVLGRPLRPLSYGHLILLNRFGLDPIMDLKGLMFAVEICSRTYSEGLEFATGVFTSMGLRELERKAASTMACDVSLAIKAWAEYIEAGYNEPEFSKSDEPVASKKGAPFLAQLRCWLLTRCNYSPDTIMDTPYSQCLWDYGTSIEELQGFGIVGERHRAIEELLRN